MKVVYDAGVLIAADRNDRRIWAEHRVLLEADTLPATTAPVVAQSSRSPQQVQLQRFLRGCQVEAFDPEQAHAVGALLARARTSDVVDAHVMAIAAARGAEVWTSDPDDLHYLNESLRVPVALRRI